MTPHQRQLIRLAIAIHAQLHGGQSASSPIALPGAAWQRCESAHRQLVRATGRGWQTAADSVTDDLRFAVTQLCGDLASFSARLGPPQRPVLPTAREIYADLLALETEFDEVTFDSRARTLSVLTEAIELEGIYLGPFRVELEWCRLADGHPGNYRVIANDPNPASSNDNVTHPHVQDEAVCEGDGRQPIQNALAQGRILDFFLLVANLLRTYNDSSPYVPLKDWHGVGCIDCGYSVSDDDRRSCDKCGECVCDECYCSCQACDGDFCSECISRCDGCEERHCMACLTACYECSERFCQGCLQQDERCEGCHDQDSNEEEGDDSGTDRQPEPADAPVHTNGVGQAVVSA